MIIRSLAASAAAIAIVASVPAPAWAQERTYTFDIPAGDLGAGIREFAKESRQQVSFDGTLVAGKRGNAVKGSFAPDQALTRLLAGTGLGYRKVDRGVFVLTAGEMGNGIAAAETADSKGEENSARRTENESVEDQTITVTGTRLEAGNGSVPVKKYRAEDIAETGTTTVAEFLNTLPEVSVQSSPDRFSSAGGETFVQLHGFPIGTTATLLNGRRLAPAADLSAAAFDLSTLPLAFIERIDVLPSGSSAVYGSDAIAGVVNFITKRDFTGVHLSASVRHAADYTEQNYSAAWGKVWDHGSVSMVASYETHGALFGHDRDIVANADYRRFGAQGGVDRRVPFCSPGNVFSPTAANLPGLSSTVAAIPPGVTGRPAVGDFIATQGAQNLCSPFKDFGLVPAVDRKSFLANGHFEITSSVEAFAELLYSHAKTSYIAPLLTATLAVPASNAFNPFGANVIVKTELAVPQGTVAIKDYFRPLIGLRGKLSSKWRWEVALWRSQDHSPLFSHAVTQGALLAAALASSDRTTALNPFSSAEPGSASVLASIYPTLPIRFRLDVNVIDSTLRGQLFDLPAGPVSFAIGGEYQWQHYVDDPRAQSPTTAVTAATRQVGAVYSELRLPILGGRNGGDNLLDVMVAGRYDHYNDFGGKATPQIGIEVRPTDGLLLRASYAQAFKAPQLPQVYGSQSTFPGLILVDNGRPGNPITTNVSLISGGNRHLRPETGNAYSLGLVWSGGQVPGLKASLDYWWLGEDNRVTLPSFAAILGNPDIFPGRVVRDANGVLLSLDASPANFGSLRAQGFDLDVTYGLDTAWGKFTTNANWVRTTKFMAALTPGAALVDRLGQATVNDAWAVKDKVTVGLGWRQGHYALHAAARYLGPYRDYPTTPANTNRLGNDTLFDLSGAIDLGGRSQGKYLQHAKLTASIVNLFDKRPQYSNFNSGNVGYDPAQADILGRAVRVGLALDW